MWNTFVYIFLVLDGIYALNILFKVLYTNEKENYFLIFIIINVVFFTLKFLRDWYIITKYGYNSKYNNPNYQQQKKTSKRKNNKFNKQYGKDNFEGRKRTERIFSKEERTIHDTKEFEQWKKQHYAQFEPKKPILEEEYIILDITLTEKETMTKKILKEKYHKIAKIYHPDKGEGNIERMKEINAAYKTLSKRY